MTKRSPESVEERIALLQQTHFGPTRELKPTDPLEPTPLVVPIERMKEYDRNPRREPNQAYDVIKQSIRQRGFRGTLPITRRPGDELYMVAEGGNTVLHIVKELHEETGDPRFFTIHCLFEPWVSESETLIAHLVENDARGELLLIDRARAVHALRALLEQETNAKLSSRRLAEILRSRGYSIDQPSITRLEYVVETLLPVMPQALRAGLGEALIRQIRKLEETLTAFLRHRHCDETTLTAIRRWFLECLVRHDGEDWALEPIERELEAHLTEALGESIAKVRADLDAIRQFGEPGEDAPPPAPLVSPTAIRPKSQAGAPAMRDGDRETEPAADNEERTATDGGDWDKAGFDDEQEVEAEKLPDGGDTPIAEELKPIGSVSPAQRLPQDVKSLRSRMWTLATRLAQRNGLAECVLTCPKGCGYLFDLPSESLYAGEIPTPKEGKRIALWWFLSAVSEQWPYDEGRLDMAPALSYHEHSRIYPLFEAMVRRDNATAERIVVPLLNNIVTLDIASRQLFAVFDDREFELFIRLIETRRALHAQCRRLGNTLVWDL